MQAICQGAALRSSLSQTENFAPHPLVHGDPQLQVFCADFQAPLPWVDHSPTFLNRLRPQYIFHYLVGNLRGPFGRDKAGDIYGNKHL